PGSFPLVQAIPVANPAARIPDLDVVRGGPDDLLVTLKVEAKIAQLFGQPSQMERAGFEVNQLHLRAKSDALGRVGAASVDVIAVIVAEGCQVEFDAAED